MPYQATDKVVAYLIKLYIRLFHKAKGIMKFDEVNVIDLSHEIYDTAEKLTEQEMLRLAETVYEQHRKKKKKTEPEPESIDMNWVLLFLGKYNPTTKYVYQNEVERRRARFAEALIATSQDVSGVIQKIQDEIGRALRSLVSMNKQLADDVTLAAMVQAFKDDGYEYVEWITYEDDKRCPVCKQLDGKIFRIDKIPAKPHLHCRCYVQGVRR